MVEAAWSTLAAGFELRRPGGVHVQSVAVEPLDLGSLWQKRNRGPAFLFGPTGEEGEATLGLGAAALIEATGPERFVRVRQLATALFVRSTGEPARLWGGFAFAPRSLDAQQGETDARWWREWPDARFVLPRWSYTHGAAPRLQLAITDQLTPSEALRQLTEILSGGSPIARPRPTAALTDEMSRQEWATLVDEIKGAIAAGRFHKIVAARAAVVRATQPFDEASLLFRLTAPACTRFAFAGGETLFVGATPERLVRRAGRIVDSEALAGTIGDVRSAGELLRRSKKDLDEHAWVVRGVSETLAPFSLDVQHPLEPSLLPLRNITHLRTPIRATLSSNVHVLDLVAALHPTPALGGSPRREAADYIVGHEPTSRGWYGAPIGWFDGQGDGAFWVALRSGVIDGARARLFAGAGIVSASVAAHEYEETALKQRALAGVLGVAP